jgi:aspartyl/asparaginyl-tRNA synthetase
LTPCSPSARRRWFLNGFVDTGLIDRLKAVRDADFARVSYTDAVEILKTSAHGL